jgi:NADPH2:quinone reductase
MTMRAILCDAFGPIDALRIGAAPVPAVGPGEVRLRMRAAAANFADTVMIGGTYQEKPALPFVPGLEGAGEIVEIGAGVGGLTIGDRVMATLPHGAFAEQAVTGAAQAYRIPDGLDFAEAAAVPVAYGTSHVALTRRGNLQPGETLLVLGAAGGVGLTAVEIGKALGAIVIAAASGPEKLALAQAYGADHAVDYTKDDLRDAVRDITGGRGADVIYDPVGGEAFKSALRCIAWEGRLLVIGFASGEVPQAAANYLLVKNASVVGVYWGAYRKHNPALIRGSFATLAGWFADGTLKKPHISHRLPLEKAVEALTLLTTRRSTGKVVLTIDG